MLKVFLQGLIRRRSRVEFQDPLRTRPVSATFGMERGTPIDRRYIERFLAANAAQVRGDVLEVGGDTYTRRFGGAGVRSCSVLHATPDNRRATIVGDLTDTATLPEARFDCFVCTQTLNFVFDVARAVEGMRHVLKPGGVALVTAAGISQVSRYDMDRWGDYWRFTTASLGRLFEPHFPGAQIGSHGNVLAAVALLQGLAVEDLPRPELLDDPDADYPVTLTVVARRP